jgi:hypothetical protein
LPAGEAQLKTWLTDAYGTTRGAYYLDVEHLEAGRE